MSDRNEAVRARLLEKHLRGEQGIWQIFGEDPNADMGGCHSQPLLGTVQGDYESAVDYALGMSGFFTWGDGGRLEKVDILKVDSSALKVRTALLDRRAALKAQLAAVEVDLKKMGVK